MFGALIIGDELLVGKREDKHLGFLIGALKQRGLRLAWAEYLGDDPARTPEEEVMLSAYFKAVFHNVLGHQTRMILGERE